MLLVSEAVISTASKALILISLLLSVELAGCGGGSSTGAGTGNHAGLKAEMARLVNLHRQRVGCSPLIWNQALSGAAQSQSDDMATRNFRSHTNPDGDGYNERLGPLGFARWGENIAWVYYYDNPQLAFDWWLGSPDHRANIENCSYAFHGVGVSYGQGQYLWTEDFGG